MSSKGGGGVEQLLYRGGITQRGGGVVVIQTNTFAGKHGSTFVPSCHECRHGHKNAVV